MGKTTTTSTILCITTLILLLTSSRVLARPGPAFHDVTPIENQRTIDQEGQKVADEEKCVGLGDDECLMKRTIEAQLDYIYTQNKNNKP
ncbi:hypothetical protein C2S51_004908 [Perilla frutescens var. frutescens]|nr:hypothetical protein C2S51_004908 [Perilla frutescens var. frutescens]